MGFSRIDYQSTEEIMTYQEQRLQEVLAYVNEYSPFYKTLFAERGIDVSTIRTIEDLQSLPLTTKDDLQRQNDAFFCVPKTSIIDYATTSGTLGDPVTFGLTDSDLDRLAENEYQSFKCAGVQEGDVVQLMTTIDRRFMAGLAYFLGLRKLGAGVIRVGAGIPQLQWDSILQYQPKYLIAVPSFLLKLIDYAEKNDIDYNNCSVKGVICIGEALRQADLTPSILADRITEKWDIKLFSTYASTEMGAAFTECEYHQGGHVNPELIITEVLDEENNVVADGELGELTVTTLGVEALPLIRFKTGDMVRKHTSTCSCGRHTYRLGPVEGRKRHMIKYKGTTLYPPAIVDLLNSFPQIKMHLIEVSTNEIGTDEIVIRIVTEDDSQEFSKNIKDTFRAKLRVAPKVVIESVEVLQPIVFNPMSRKPITFIDKRV
ncbi:AMP-binding protein [Myroides marinus]|uniref:phenylacetate--CoA ligase family protein n=1 Tax=Myroides marinus TaxID=703342 RepID=UPI002576FB19|nr:AMP-binding protein [Myroides marinus]MDM1348235.1 AMP-binding protein [Myroides marinus]MDM1351748.1 AMP-binding protein [Myroides marinus]MDM1355337.1 AMP-binding protein [Myroides marinus]MDM1358955.1 AMP-binding protein [Myroides marinus]MDM1366009.1 AMP-binding protein [Myroides marinus]